MHRHRSAAHIDDMKQAHNRDKEGARHFLSVDHTLQQKCRTGN